jgi:hypothetical protein
VVHPLVGHEVDSSGLDRAQTFDLLTEHNSLFGLTHLSKAVLLVQILVFVSLPYESSGDVSSFPNLMVVLVNWTTSCLFSLCLFLGFRATQGTCVEVVQSLNRALEGS